MLVYPFLSEEFSAKVVVIHAADVGHFNFFRTLGLAGSGIGTAAKTFGIHLRYHGLYAAPALGLSLRQQRQLR